MFHSKINTLKIKWQGLVQDYIVFTQVSHTCVPVLESYEGTYLM